MTQTTNNTAIHCYRCNRHASPFRRLYLIAGHWMCERCRDSLEGNAQ